METEEEDISEYGEESGDENEGERVFGNGFGI